MQKKVLIAIPSFNEEENLPNLYESISAYNTLYDIVVIDDGSTDNTATIARKLGFSVLQLPANLGIGGAMQTGFKYATEHAYEIVIQFDGDGQHDPVWLEKLITPILTGKANCVIGSRYCKDKPDKNYNTPLFRRIGMIFSTSLLWIATKKTITDTTSGFRALDRSAFTFFSKAYPVDHPEAEALLMLIKNGFRLTEIPVTMKQRKTGSSLFGWYKIINYPFRVLIGFLEILIRNNPK